MPANYQKYIVRGIGVAAIGALAFASGFYRTVELRSAQVERVKILWYEFLKNDTLPSGEIMVKTPEEKDSIPEGLELKIKGVAIPIRFEGIDASTVHANDILPNLIYERGLPTNKGKFFIATPYPVNEVFNCTACKPNQML